MRLLCFRRRTIRWSDSCSAIKKAWPTHRRRQVNRQWRRRVEGVPRRSARSLPTRSMREKGLRTSLCRRLWRRPFSTLLSFRLILTFLSDLSIFLDVLWRGAPSSAPLSAGRLHSRRSILSIADNYTRLLFYLSVHKIYLEDIIYYVYFLTWNSNSYTATVDLWIKKVRKINTNFVSLFVSFLDIPHK